MTRAAPGLAAGRAGRPAREARAAPESPRARSNAVGQRPRRNRPAGLSNARHAARAIRV
ncbi:hypothetical protein GBP346_B0802 [Burkholderia pseudomallei MSHR346]|nr:hypothetical protein GBP346_B0802 [Burkholderia pseudomallei MSHR346]